MRDRAGLKLLQLQRIKYVCRVVNGREGKYKKDQTDQMGELQEKIPIMQVS